MLAESVTLDGGLVWILLLIVLILLIVFLVRRL